jgi:TetR/AcrR family transcriptional repressor of nem operon
MSSTNAGPNTAKQILDLACELAQTRGYNAFSYRDLARQIGIRSASVHHHFPTKADLGRAMIQRYRAQFAEMLEGIDRSRKSPSEKLRAYFDLFRQTARSDRGVCLGGMLAADILTLAAEVQTELNGFFTDSEEWLRGVLEAGVASGDLSVNASPGDVAVTIVSTLEGAMMVARAHGDAATFDRACRGLLESLISSFRHPG